MALFNKDSVDVNLHKTSKELETTVVMASDVKQTAITNNIAGYKWEVDFYNQILGNGDEPKQPDVGLNITLQSYRLIENMEMIMSSTLTSSNPNDLSGEGYVNIGSVVNKYDIFIAKVHNNKTAIFYIDEISEDTYENNNIFKVTFKLFAYSTDSVVYENIINKVATNYVYNKEYKFTNNTPVILKKNAFNFDYGTNVIKSIMTLYFNKYFNLKLRYLTIEDGDIFIDPYLNDFITKVFSSEDYPVLLTINRLEGARENDITIFNALVESLDIRHINKLYSSGPSLYYRSNYFKNVMHIEYMVDRDIVNYKPYFEDKHYFIDSTFYDGTVSDDDKFGNILMAFVKDKEILHEDIISMIDTLSFDNLKEDYYKVPILCYLYSVFLWRNL